MLSTASQTVIGTLLYTGKYENLDDALVERRANALIEEPLGELTAADEYQAILEALQSTVKLTEIISLPDFIQKKHTEQDFRDFLRRLLDCLDNLRPWPQPPHRKLDYSRWYDYRDARVVGRVKMDWVHAQSRVQYLFNSVEDRDRELWVLILRLRSGDDIALVTPWWPDSEDVAVLSREPERSPGQVLAALFDGTRFSSQEVVPVAPDDQSSH